MNISSRNLKPIYLLLLLTSSIKANPFNELLENQNKKYEERIILSGFTKHWDDKNIVGKKFNSNNWGIGYERSFFKNYNEAYLTYGGAIILDSYKNIFPFVNAGYEYRFNTFIPTAIGLNALIGVKKIPLFERNENGELYETATKYLPFSAIAPSVKILSDNFSLNLYVTPNVKVQTEYFWLNIVGFVYGTVGYKF